MCGEEASPSLPVLETGCVGTVCPGLRPIYYGNVGNDDMGGMYWVHVCATYAITSRHAYIRAT